MHLVCGVCYTFVDKCKQSFDNEKSFFSSNVVLNIHIKKLQKNMKSGSKLNK